MATENKPHHLNSSAAAVPPVPIPPAALRFMRESDEDFLRIGDMIVQDLKSLAQLHPRSTVLDIGSGYGRVAHALLRRADFHGRYLGIDILPRHIEWCRSHLEPITDGRIAFRHLDVQNARYNPHGRLSPEQVDFNVPDAFADVVCLTSVFTHMYDTHIRRYLELIRRALAPDGRALMTFFLLNGSQRAAQARVAGKYSTYHRLNDYSACMNQDDPLHVIAYEEGWVREQLAEAGLQLVHDIRYGTWCGRSEGTGLQDVVVVGPMTRRGTMGTGSQETKRVGSESKAQPLPAVVCSACDARLTQFAPGPRKRADARCPRCQALERHRFLAYLLRRLSPVVVDSVVLDIAPQPQIARIFARHPAVRYIGTDLEQNGDVSVVSDITRLPLPTGCCDVLICYHVLEHVPDDAAAMAELARVLKDGGFALVQVPWRPDRATDEDPELPPRERLKRFGQEDHVRWYGADFEDRLERAGLRFARIEPRMLLDEASLKHFGLIPNETVWIVRRGQGRAGLVPVPDTALLEHSARHHFEGARSNVDPSHDELARLRARRSVRLALAAARLTRPLFSLARRRQEKRRSSA